MKKILTEVYVPVIEEKYDVFIPNNKNIKTIIKLLEKSINELSEGNYKRRETTMIYNKENGLPYEADKTVKESNIINGTKLILY